MSWFHFFHTVPNLHFLSKNSTLICRENCRFFGVKNSWKCCGFGLYSCWQLWFHEKNCQKKIWVKNSWKCWGPVKIEFLDKNLTFRIVCKVFDWCFHRSKLVSGLRCSWTSHWIHFRKRSQRTHKLSLHRSRRLGLLERPQLHFQDRSNDQIEVCTNCVQVGISRK